MRTLSDEIVNDRKIIINQFIGEFEIFSISTSSLVNILKDERKDAGNNTRSELVGDILNDRVETDSVVEDFLLFSVADDVLNQTFTDVGDILVGKNQGNGSQAQTGFLSERNSFISDIF